MKEGKFITLEGGEGVGKSTNLNFVKLLLESRGLTVVTTREPGGTVLAENIRGILLENQQETVSETAELLMMFAARAQHILHVIKPAMEKGHWVLCDRFTDSTYAYQGGGRGIDVSMIEWLENNVQQGIKPDLTLLLDAPVAIGMERANKRAALDRFELEKQQFFEKVRATFLQRAKNNPQDIKTINAAQSLDKVQHEIALVVRALL